MQHETLLALGFLLAMFGIVFLIFFAKAGLILDKWQLVLLLLAPNAIFIALTLAVVTWINHRRIQAIPSSLYRHFWLGRLILCRPDHACMVEKADTQTQQETGIQASTPLDNSDALGYTLIVRLR